MTASKTLMVILDFAGDKVPAGTNRLRFLSDGDELNDARPGDRVRGLE